MKKIYLVRHAQYENPRQILVGRLPVPLSEDGIKEAEKLADFFADKKISKIYSSPVLRCKQTSQIISQNEIAIVEDLRIAETLSAYQGYWDYDWKHFFQNYNNLGGEQPQDIQNRVSEFWEEIKDQNKENIIICSHGDPLYLLYAYLTKLPTPDINEIYQIPDEEYQPKASIRPIIYDNKKISINPMIPIIKLT